jgi:multidrug efflux pump subunit AcrA (membrane-fusion protein)
MSYRLSNLFREQARRSLDEVDQHGAPLRLTPAWIEWSYWLLVTVGAVSLLLAALTDIGEYAQGPAMVRLLGRTQVGAIEPGVVAKVLVEPGSRVVEGELLVQLDDVGERAELERLDAELRAATVELLRRPTDETRRSELAGLRAERELAAARVERRAIRAPHDGVMSDARVSPGQHVEAGEVLLTLVGAEARRELVAALPGHYRPLVHPGMKLHLELTGYEAHAQELTIEAVGDEVIGPAAVERLLGEDRAETLTISGPAVLVRARLPEPSFAAGSHRYPYFDGMAGIVEVRVRSQSVLTSLIPGLRELSEADEESQP